MLITAYGRRNLLALTKLATEIFGTPPIYGETDSVFVLNSTPDKKEKFEALTKKSVADGGLGIPVRYEKTFSRLLLVMPKNYMGQRPTMVK